MTKPLLLLDVDGVLNPLANTPPPGFRTQVIDGFEVATSVRHRRWLQELSGSFELVWATTWEDSANQSIGPLLGLPTLRVVSFGPDREGETWKLSDVRTFVGERDLVWVDDELYPDAFRWAEEREAPTLLVRPSPGIGLAGAHIEEIRAFVLELEES